MTALEDSKEAGASLNSKFDDPMAPRSSRATARGNVLMLVGNPCVNDGRVIKSAEALVEGGWTVVVLCQWAEGLPVREVRRGVVYERFPTSQRTTAAARSGRSRGRSTAGTAATGFRTTVDEIPALLGRLIPDFLRGGYSRTRRTVGRCCAEDRTGCLRIKGWKSTVRQTVGRLLRTRPARVLMRSIKRLVKRYLWRPVRTRLRSIKRLVKTYIWAPQPDPLGRASIARGQELAPEIVHCHDLSTLRMGARIAKAAGAQLVYDSHELEMHRNASYPIAVHRWRRWIEKHYIRRTAAVVTVSDSIADHLRDDYRIPRPWVVLNAPTFDDAVVPIRDVRADLGLPNATPIAVYVGSVTINRGIDIVVRALASRTDLHFATVGPRRPQTEAYIKDLAEDLGVGDRLHLIDPLPPEEVVGYIRTATVSVLPIQNVCLSYNYCMPNKLLESAFAGVPVAVADLVEMRKFVGSYRCGEIMDETDPVAVAEAIGKIVADPTAYRMSPERREELARLYGWLRQAQHLRNLYASLAPSSASERAGAIGISG